MDYPKTKHTEIPEQIVDKWQALVDIMAEVLDVPAGLIMRVKAPYIEVFRSSKVYENPYEVGAQEHLAGLYCEEVISSENKLLVPNAQKDERWRDNPDVELGMISYLGLPLKWPDGNIFGTICVLDTKENHYSKIYENSMRQFRELVESHLNLLAQRNDLEKEILEKEKLEKALQEQARVDELTGAFNRRKFYECLDYELKRSERIESSLSLLMFDIDHFKAINDNYGHKSGDEVLKEVVQVINENVRDIDMLFRWGGEEFLVLTPDTDIYNARNMAMRLRSTIANISFYNIGNITVSIGATSYRDGESKDTFISRVDNCMYLAKQEGRNKVKVQSEMTHINASNTPRF